MSPPMTLDARQKQTYEEDGVVLLRQAISEKWLRFLESASEELEARPGPMAEKILGSSPDEEASTSYKTNSRGNKGKGEYFTDLEMAQRLPSFEEFARSGPCAALAGEAMASEQVCFLYDQYFRQDLPPPTDRSEVNFQENPCQRPLPPITPWHQDQPYWSIRGEQVVSLWIPLDATPEGYAVQFVKGSHKWGEYAPFHFANGKEYAGTGLPRLPDVERGIRKGELEVLSFPDAVPGDVVMFSAMAVHGQSRARAASPSRSPDGQIRTAASEFDAKAGAGQRKEPTRFRRLAVRFTGDDARYLPRWGEAADVVPSAMFPCALSPGERMACARCPLVWTRSGGLVNTTP